MLKWGQAWTTKLHSISRLGQYQYMFDPGIWKFRDKSREWFNRIKDFRIAVQKSKFLTCLDVHGLPIISIRHVYFKFRLFGDVNIKKRWSRKLRGIILLQIGRMTFKFHFGKYYFRLNITLGLLMTLSVNSWYFIRRSAHGSWPRAEYNAKNKPMRWLISRKSY